jgi:hypothetical protein
VGAASASASASASVPRVAIATAGRRGIGRPLCEALVASPIQALVYISCCDATLAADVATLVEGPRAFAVADAARYDHFPGTSFQGAALLLLRRPASLVLPVGPAGSGKTSLCAALAAGLPRGSCIHLERDAILAAERRGGGGLNAAKRRAHHALSAAVHAAHRDRAVCLVDSCNAAVAGRAYYARLVSEQRVILILHRPSWACDGADDAETIARHRALLLERTRGRAVHPTFPSQAEPARQQAAAEATFAAMEWPEEAVEGAAHGAPPLMLACDPCATLSEEHARLLVEVFAQTCWLVDAGPVAWPTDGAGMPAVPASDGHVPRTPCGVQLQIEPLPTRLVAEMQASHGLGERVQLSIRPVALPV